LPLALFKANGNKNRKLTLCDFLPLLDHTYAQVGDKRVVDRFAVAKGTGIKTEEVLLGWNICKMTGGGVVRD